MCGILVEADSPCRASSYLIAKAFRFTRLLEYARKLPRFRIPLLLSALALLINSSLYIPITFIDNSHAIYILPVVAIFLDVTSRYALALLGRLYNTDKFTSKHKDVCIPAINVEHLMERTLQFVVIVFGEAVINAGYIAQVNQFGPSAEFARSACAIVIAFTLVSNSTVRQLRVIRVLIPPPTLSIPYRILDLALL